jgi:protein-glutamine gamma-glutamyltransferase
MNAIGVAPRPRSSPWRSLLVAGTGEWQLPTLAIVAFSCFALLAGIRFAALLRHPPTLRLLGVVLIATAAGGVLSASVRLSPRLGMATVARTLVLALASYLALRVAGVPARLLWPWRWAQLARDVSHGLHGLTGSWPYRGEAPWARTSVTLALPAAIVPAAALAFWPRALHARRARLYAFGLLLGLYLLASVNQTRVGWQVQGLLLLTLTCLWAWGWRTPPPLAVRTVAWALALSTFALLGAGLLSSPKPILNYRSWNPFAPAFRATRFEWNQVYGPLPWTDTAETMVSVKSVKPHLWRATTLDRFDGVRFLRSNEPPAETTVREDAALHPKWIVQATFTVRGLESNQLLSPGAIASAHVSGTGSARPPLLAPDQTMSLPGAALPGETRYSVSAYVPQPSVSEMREASDASPETDAPYTRFDLPVERSAEGSLVAAVFKRGEGLAEVSAESRQGRALIEQSPYRRVYELARRLDAGAHGRYALVTRVEAFLHRGFTYNTDPPRTRLPLISFLFSQRSGYCQQFSGAMTLLLRMDGVPARVGAGFLSGSRNPSTGTYEVSAHEAHAWVEVYFAGIGWVAFDPTPAASKAGRSSISLAKLGGTHAATGASSASSASPRARSPRPRASAGHTSHGVVGLLALATGLGAILALGGVWIAVISTRRRERDPDGAVRELLGALSRLGVHVTPGTTLSELERRMAISHGPAAAHYILLLRERRYASEPDPSLPTVGDRRHLRRALGTGRGLRSRLKALIALPPAIARR